MELFDSIGLSDAFLSDANLVKGFIFNFHGKTNRPTLDFSTLDSPHPYILVCSQKNTERKLRDHLRNSFGFEPEWGTQLSHLSQEATEDKELLTATLKHTDGSEETLHPLYVVGCDGTHSTVRTSVGIENDKSKYEGMLMQLMDVNVNNFDGADDWIHYHMSKESFFLLCKLPEGGHRIVISKMREDIDPSLAPQELFQQLIDGHMQNTKLDEPQWATKWQIWKRLAEKYSAGNVFLAGDAAHVHSPSGGQGMNVGIQDAFNLGWKLAAVIKGLARRDVLATYEKERKPIAAQVIDGTDAMHNIIMGHGKGMQDRLKLTQAPGWHDAAVSRISGLSYHYRDASTTPISSLKTYNIRAGDRAPLTRMACDEKLAELLRFPYLRVLVICGNCEHADVLNACARFQAAFPNLVRAQSVEKEDKDLVRGFDSVEGDNVFVLRPDGYIYMRCALEDVEAMMDYMKRSFHAL